MFYICFQTIHGKEMENIRVYGWDKTGCELTTVESKRGEGYLGIHYTIQSMRVKEESENASLKLNIKKIKIMASSSITSWQVEGEKEETVTDFIFLGSKITADGDCSHEMKRHFLLGRKAMTNLDSLLKTHCFTNKGLSSQSYGFSSSHVWMWELVHKESWVSKNWCLWTVVLEKTLESPLDSKEIQPVHP